ncbi:DUF397 domain-containing protein [Spirillospora sp. NPDC049024]
MCSTRPPPPLLLRVRARRGHLLSFSRAAARRAALGSATTSSPTAFPRSAREPDPVRRVHDRRDRTGRGHLRSGLCRGVRSRARFARRLVPPARRPLRKSSHSGTQGGSGCVEVGRLPGTIAFRDSKDPDGPQLHVTRDAFRLILATLKG